MFHATSLIVPYLEENGFHYMVMDEPDSSSVYLPYGITNGPMVYIQFTSRDEGNSVGVRVMGLFNDVSEERRETMTSAINMVNNTFRYVKFCLDEDGDINVEADFPRETPDELLGPYVKEYASRTYKIIEDAYPTLINALWEN